MKRRLSLLIGILLLLSTMPTLLFAAESVPACVEIVPDYSWYGDGTADEFTIDSVEDLAGLANITNGKDNQTKFNFLGKTVKLGADIAFADNQYWYYNDGTTEYDYCIGTFAGTFDGAVAGSTTDPVETHTITGLKVYKTTKTDITVGLFKEINATGCVKNLTLNNVSVDISHKDKTDNKVASIAYTLKGKAENCHVNDVRYTVAGYLNGSGSMFGDVNTTAEIKNSSAKDVYVTISDAYYTNNYGVLESDNGQNTGGFAGSIVGSETEKVIISNCSIENVYFDCTYKLKRFGGFVGRCKNTTFTDCTATNVNFDVDDYIYRVGGFVGSVYPNSDFDNCDVAGVRMDLTRVSNTATRVGGFVGTTEEGTPISFTNCDVTGVDITMHVRANSPIGGFAGDLRNAVTIESCTAAGKIDATDTSADSAAIGGFIGSTSAATTIKDSYADVDVTANGDAGGFAGDAKNLTVENCIATGDVTSTNGSAGGFAGINTGTSTITGCTATGSVTSTYGVAGGMVGYVSSGAAVTFSGDCVPATNVSGVITSSVANALNQEFSISGDVIASAATDPVCYSEIGGCEIGYNSIQDAVNGGATTVTLLKTGISEDFTVHSDLTLNLGSNIMSGEISVADGTITVETAADGSEVIRGINITINGDEGNTSDITLAEPYLDHYQFSGWCRGEQNVPVYAESGKAEIGHTYHSTHWVKSDYEHDDLHHVFEMVYGEAVPDKSFTVTFKYRGNGADEAKVVDVTQGDFFNAAFEEGSLTVTITPSNEQIKLLKAGTYEDVIHVKVHDNSTHGIHIKLIIKEAKVSSSRHYTLSFNVGQGEAVQSVSARYGSDIELSNYSSTRAGYTFIGWFSDATLENEITSVHLTKNTTVYAGWKIDNPFSDVSEMDWFYNEVMYVYQRGLMVGTSDSDFDPLDTVNRAMIVTILYRLERSPDVAGINGTSFSDIMGNEYYADAVVWAAANGIVNGYPGNVYKPLDDLTREQLAAILFRYATFKGYDVSAGENTNILSYTDFDEIAEYAITAMQWSCGEGIINGVGSNKLDPDGEAIRAHLAIMLMRFCEEVAK